MALRDIITIDESKCDGCGLCANKCAEGAIRIIDGKARLIGESLCDGLGVCVGECPRGAITVEKRESEAYDDKTAGKTHDHPGCPGSRERTFVPVRRANAANRQAGEIPSELTHWPIQLHLINPSAPHFAGGDILIAADCTAFALGSFHGSLLAGKKLVIACPKLDQGKDIYVKKMGSLIAGARSVTVAIMEVPCCSGLLKLVLDARTSAGGDKPISVVTVGIDGTLKGFRTH